MLFEEFTMNINIRVILATIAVSLFLSGCELPAVGGVSTASYNEIVSKVGTANTALEKANKERDAAKLELKFWKEKPQEQIIPDIDRIVKKAVAESCQAKASAKTTVAKALVKKLPQYGGKQVNGGIPSPYPITATASASASLGSAHAEAHASVGPQAAENKTGNLDHCIFRIDGKIKADIYLPDGKTACPAWRDKQIVLYHTNPNDQIWAKVYPSN